MRPVNAQVTGGFVYFVLHQVKWRDLDECCHDAAGGIACLEPMPGVWSPVQEFLCHRSNVRLCRENDTRAPARVLAISALTPVAAIRYPAALEEFRLGRGHGEDGG